MTNPFLDKVEERATKRRLEDDESSGEKRSWLWLVVGLVFWMAEEGGPPPLERWRLLALTGAMCGVQACYAAQVGHGSAALEEFGMKKGALEWVRITWTWAWDGSEVVDGWINVT